MKKSTSKLKTLFNLGHSTDKNPQEDIYGEQYIETFIKEKSKEQIGDALERAYDLLKFEVDNYWKRATYFWAFQVAAFAGYFSVLDSEAFIKSPIFLFYTICIGFITAVAWNLINIGSRAWQRHWHMHVERLEDTITGPLFKVGEKKKFSVTRLNEIVSRFIIVIWIILACQYLWENISFEGRLSNFDFKLFFAALTTLFFCYEMRYGYGRVKQANKSMKNNKT